MEKREKEMKVVIERFKTQLMPDKQILGSLFVVSDECKMLFNCFTLELPDRENQNNISNIPPGKYKCVKRSSQRYGNHFHILDVPGRTLILIHQGNYFTQTEGCVLVGSGLSDINKDGLTDVTNSVNTMKKLNELLPNEFFVEVFVS